MSDRRCEHRHGRFDYLCVLVKHGDDVEHCYVGSKGWERNFNDVETKHDALVAAVDEFLESKKLDQDEHDWSQCRSDDEVEKRMKKEKYSRSDAGCAFATLEEKLGKYR